MDFLKAAEAGLLEKVLNALKEGVPVDTTDQDGWTALMFASSCNHPEVVEKLLAAGAQPDHQDNSGFTALMAASLEGHKEVVEALLKEGFTVDMQDKSGFTALMAASQEGHKEVVEALLKEGSTVDMQDKSGLTALMTASQEGHREVAEALLKGGGTVDMQNKNGQTALMAASWKGHAKVVEKLLAAGAQPDNQDNSGFTALMAASQEGHKEVVEALLKEGSTVDMQDKSGFTALMAASQKGHKEVVEALLKGGGTVDMQKASGSTALMAASKEGHMEVVEALLKGGATVDIQKKNGLTALMFASGNNHPEVTEKLLAAGAQPDHQDNDDFTALMLASQEGHEEAVEALLMGGSTVDMKKKDGTTAVSLATSHGHHELAELLHRASTENPKEAPRVIAQPGSESSLLGTTVSFHVEATGEAPLHFSWLHDGSAVDGAEGPVLTLRGVGLADVGGYQCRVENKFGKVVSLPAELKVAAIEYSDLQFLGDKPLGGGGFGTVWKGKWKPGGNLVAIKRVMQLIEREVKILQQLKHPNVIQFHGVVSEPHSVADYIITEYAENGSIHDYIHVRKENPTLEQGLLWAEQVAEGMQYLHKNNYIHRDLKTQNVVLTSDLIAKICDLGSARIQDHPTKQTTAVGTYEWMAPEMLEKEDVSKTCDVYSYGILLWAIITHKVPFADVLHVFLPAKVLEGKRPPIPDSCEPYLKLLMECCWQKSAKDRPSFAEILTVLKDNETVSVLNLSTDAVKDMIDLKPRIAQLMNLQTTKGDRVNIIKSIAPDWKDVGFLMDLDPEGQKVVSIAAEHKHDGPEICCREMFALWLQSPEATWGNLIELLVLSEQKELAEQVKDILGL